MDELLRIFDRALSERLDELGKKDNLVGIGEILSAEFKKQREQIIVLGKLLADSYASDNRVSTSDIYQRMMYPDAKPQ